MKAKKSGTVIGTFTRVRNDLSNELMSLSIKANHLRHLSGVDDVSEYETEMSSMETIVKRITSLSKELVRISRVELSTSRQSGSKKKG